MFLVVCAFLIIASAPPVLAEAKVKPAISNDAITIYTEDWPPFTFEEDGQLKGFSVEVVRAIQDKVHDTTPIQIAPWTRGYHEALANPNVILLAMIRSKEREKLFTLLGPLGETEIALYGLAKPRFPINSIASGKSSLLVAALQDSIYSSALKDAGFKNIEHTKNPEQEARQLAAGRVDLIATDPCVIKAAFKKIGRSDLELKKYLTIAKSEVYISFSKGTKPDIILKWKNALKEIKQDGTFAKLAHKWTPEKLVLMEVVLLSPDIKIQKMAK